MKILSSEITSYKFYINRRNFIKSSTASMVASLIPLNSHAFHKDTNINISNQLDKNDKLNTYEEITTYNNFYEFGTAKSDPSNYSKQFKPRPWSISIEGLVEKPGLIDLEDLIKEFTVEDRIYRLRCVEAWSMVIPWQGFSLNRLIKKVEPKSDARYIQFVTVFRPDEMPGQKRRILPWPYVEGLRMDEAMHPLTILSTGMYGHELLNQNGAPLRLVVPWKYGFKSIKSIVAIRFVKDQPTTTWPVTNPSEYAFYSNVNPEVDHRRWSQASERRIGEFKRRSTLMFNGYEEEVSYMYKNMDLKKFF
ncbi:MAG: Protein-methionine-sulfoxide reductase catalytic subunit MsrP [Alphaproteobacteria bacterium MarineAlpha5_Bin6]|nr:MAG: Protein-methionine-sulfoxide reductase catalytic subunit MsrP [Alphaproteobacteria bacterium MarineAlpha5_Bin7]PPR53816.1 MAG: Protein-methionine-sulfoxide reductase catalytic subunit MsrP [Alphaproteobacteria bacterium MarineAlpha5_Bin6]|tara:strand:+ start:1350 stop:2267 length:918 start_codon:yes stop_codon:yes gene_type:complete